MENYMDKKEILATGNRFTFRIVRDGDKYSIAMMKEANNSDGWEVVDSVAITAGQLAGLATVVGAE